MASFNRGQLPARQTKVVDENRPLKTRSPGCGGVCNNDVSPSKPCSQGRGGIDALHTNNSCVVPHGGSRCKTCKHLVVDNSFASNVTGKSYNSSCPRGSISCGTKNVIYVIDPRHACAERVTVVVLCVCVCVSV